MKNALAGSIALVCAAVVTSGSAWATVVSVSDSSQHFTDGSHVTSGQLLTAHSGDPTPAPFNGVFIGSDSASNFSASWTMDFTPTSGTLTSADLDLGILDIDSAAAGSQVSLFSVNGVDLTSVFNNLSETAASPNSTYNVFDVSLTNALNGLAAGQATFVLDLQGPGLGTIGTSTFNGAGLDFATLNVTYTSGVVTPEPSYWPILGVLCGTALFVRSRRRA